MNRLDKAIVAWSRGNRMGHLGPYAFRNAALYQDGWLVALRVSKIFERTIILVRSEIEGRLPDSVLDQSRHFPHIACLTVDGTTINQMWSQMQTLSPLNKKNSLNDCYQIGNALFWLTCFAKKNGLVLAHENPVSENTHYKLALAGIKRQNPKRVAALLSRKSLPFHEFGKIHGLFYYVFSDYDTALLEKMRHENIWMFDLKDQSCESGRIPDD